MSDRSFAASSLLACCLLGAAPAAEPLAQDRSSAEAAETVVLAAPTGPAILLYEGNATIRQGGLGAKGLETLVPRPELARLDWSAYLDHHLELGIEIVDRLGSGPVRLGLGMKAQDASKTWVTHPGDADLTITGTGPFRAHWPLARFTYPHDSIFPHQPIGLGQLATGLAGFQVFARGVAEEQRFDDLPLWARVRIRLVPASTAENPLAVIGRLALHEITDKRIAKAWAAGNLGKALEQAEAGVAEGGEQAREAASVVLALSTHAQDGIAEARELQDRMPDLAVQRLSLLAQLFRGHAYGEHAKAALQDWRQDAAMQRHFASLDAYARFREHLHPLIRRRAAGADLGADAFTGIETGLGQFSESFAGTAGLLRARRLKDLLTQAGTR